MNLDPTAVAFSVNTRAALINKYNTYQQWIKDSKKMLETGSPKTFTNKMKYDLKQALNFTQK